MLRYLVPALAAASTAAAAACSTATATIQSSGDATALAQGCTTFTGDIVIATSAAGDIALDGITKLDGSIIAKNVKNLNSISASGMQEITGDFSLTDCTILASLNFPQLTNVGSILWSGLPGLSALSFTSEVSQASTVNIQNTQLQSLNGINLDAVDTLNLANNNFLNEVNLKLKNITSSFIVQSNGDSLAVTLPNLEWAQNMTFRNCNTVEIPSLATAGGIGYFSGGFQSASAPNLTSVNGSLTFVSNDALTNISFPKLTTVKGGLSVQNNTALQNITGFPKLETVTGALDFYGNFSSVELPSISDIHGAFNIQSTGDISSDCSTFEGEAGSNNVIKGPFFCEGTVSNPGGAGTTPSSTASGSGSTGAASALNMPSSNVMGIAGVLAAIFGLL